jgi:hypothetical protein
VLRDVDAFRYLVAEFEDKRDSPKIMAHYAVDYAVTDRSELEQSVLATLDGFVDFLSKDPQLWELYTTKFSRY